MLKALLPIAFSLMLLCKLLRHVLDAGPGTPLADVLAAGSALALVGIVFGLLGRLWLYWRRAHA